MLFFCRENPKRKQGANKQSVAIFAEFPYLKILSFLASYVKEKVFYFTFTCSYA